MGNQSLGHLGMLLGYCRYFDATLTTREATVKMLKQKRVNSSDCAGTF
jgi:hypothetical protein